MKTFALALGGGGARGLAHVAVIEALDEMGVRPVAIAGTSIGALIGSAYAAGMSGKDIHHHVIALAHRPGEIRRRLMKARAGTLAHFFSGAFSQATQMDAEKFCAQFLPDEVPADFSALQIPLTVMATDLHRRRETPISSGAAPPGDRRLDRHSGLFRPVIVDGRVLIDGGTTNPLPFDQLGGRADIVVAVDISSAPGPERVDMPSTWECVYTTILVMSGAIIAAKLAHAAPDLLIRPNVGIFRTLDFYQATAILRSAEVTKALVKERLGALACGKGLAPLLKEALEQRRSFRFRHAAIDFGPMVAGGRGEEFHTVVDRPALWIGGAVIEPADARERDGTSAHRARLERDIEIAIIEPLGAKRLTGGADGDDLSMCRRVMVGQRRGCRRAPTQRRCGRRRTRPAPRRVWPRCEPRPAPCP